MHGSAQKLHHIKAAQTPHSRLSQQRHHIIHILFLHSFLYSPRTHPAMLMATATDTVAMLILHKSTLKYPRTTRPEPQTQTPKTQTLANSSYHLHRHHTNDCITPPMHVCMYVCAQSCKSKLRKPYTPDSLSKCTKLNIHRISVLMATAPPYASSDSPLGEADQHHSPP